MKHTKTTRILVAVVLATCLSIAYGSLSTGIGWAVGPSLSGVVDEFDQEKQILTLKTSQGTAHALTIPDPDLGKAIQPGQRITVQLNSKGAVERIDPDEGEPAPPIQGAPPMQPRQSQGH